MKGDIIILEEYHYEIARLITKEIAPVVKQKKDRFCISVAGESGSGKSVTAFALLKELEKSGIKSFVIQQDDYFFLPPKTNEMRRRKNLKYVGTIEVNLGLIDHHLSLATEGVDRIEKPLVIFNENRAEVESINLKGIKVVIIEGTYTSLLQNLDLRIFIERDWHDRINSIKNRARDTVDTFLEDVLRIEHQIISEHKEFADIIIGEGINVGFINKSVFQDK